MLKRVKGGLLSILSTNRGPVSNRRHPSRRLVFLSLRVHHYEQRQSITEWFDHRMNPRVGWEPLERVPYLEIHAGKPLEMNSLLQLPYRNFPVSFATSQSELWRSDTRQLGHCFRPRLGFFRWYYEHIQEHHRGGKRRRNFPQGNRQPGSPGILANSERPLQFSSLSFGGALLVGLAIASIRVTVGLEGVVNIFNHVSEAVSAAKFSHREMDLSSGEELFLVFRVCLHKQQRSNRRRKLSMFRPSLSSGALPC